MDDEERQHLEALLQTHLANLRQLEAQAAKYGDDVPLSIHNGIIDEKSKITRIQTKLGTRAPTSGRASLQRLRRQALTAYFQKQWEQAVDLLSQVMGTDFGDDDTQKKLIEARQQLRLQEDYHAACDLRDNGQWRAVLAAMDDIEHRHPTYPDPEGLRQWAVNRQKEEMSARTVTDKPLAPTSRSGRFYRSHLLSRLVIPFLAVLFLGTTVFVALWMLGQVDQNTGEEIPATATSSQPTNTPIYAGLITYTRKNGDRTDLYALGSHGTAITLTLTLTAPYTDVEVLSVAPKWNYLALVTSREGELTWSTSYPRFIQARSGVSLFVISADGQKSFQLFQNESLRYVYAAYTSTPEWPLLIAVLRGSTVTYYVARMDGRDLHKVYDSEIVVATATPAATVPAPTATPVTTTEAP